VREAEVAGVGGELVGELEVGQRAVVLERVQPPRAEVDLVDRDRALQRVALAARAQPLLVGPLVPGLVHDGRGLGRDLGLEGHRVGLQADLAVLGEDLELVVVPAPDAGQEDLPDAARAERAHRVRAAVPVVEVADDGDRLRGRRPDGERGAAHAVELEHVRAQLLPQLLVAALADEVQVELADRRQEPVRVLGRHLPVAVGDLVGVGERQRRLREAGLEDAGRVDLLHRHRLAAVAREHGHGGGGGAPRPDDHAVAVGMGAEVGVGLRVLAGVQAIGIGHVGVISDRART
jgi:hypothetical protein